ncbi:uncharacterized protein Z520_04488 [Fonsecaea multimorphosa CBS 102226]|uniref:Obg family GTPase CgtA n=1 Tax=Fonsecaea multimorphosa CBS 102226 TaxID=1442371 RepID=A0A0D2K1W6_9EURO|nr:uncharacterized protein Z520_04488 [Fonsecaea multimorphosa CBS 102226]KIX99852.1 hypothetical protein Z520_04488 [Fonsecaea multimorphosa CBS 102226]OAL26331.1 hypothetical protein AYO22_04249 [Fonsecaea multimorphosa]
MNPVQGTLMPFLYPCLFRHSSTNCLRAQARRIRLQNRPRLRYLHQTIRLNRPSNVETNASLHGPAFDASIPPTPAPLTHLNPSPDDYSRSIFIDKCQITVHAGSGGSGCVSFLRDAHIADGPPNGGDGGSGGSVFIQAVPGQTSLHKLARRGIIKAGRGIGGQGKSQGGRRGEDICVQVPVGTVVREIWRSDPSAEEEIRIKELRAMSDEEDILKDPDNGLRNRFVIYAGATTADDRQQISSNLPSLNSHLVKPRKSHLAILQPRAPIHLDLDKPMDKPILLAAGAVGGLGNPHFATKSDPKPKFATKGELGVRIKLELELKLLADVGLVGLPNAGKSTFTRAISNSRTRIGDWAFTTLAPTIGTVILDNNEGRPLVRSGVPSTDSGNSTSSGSIVPRQSFTVADIPGLIEDAHLDKGLGLSFLRHIERARILAFVVDLSAGDAVTQLKALWKEVGEYENLRDREVSEQTEARMINWSPFDAQAAPAPATGDLLFNEEGEEISIFPSGSSRSSSTLEPLAYPPISAKPWFVIATKADVSQPRTDAMTPVEAKATSTQANFLSLAAYIKQVEHGETEHPSGKQNGWRNRVAAIPVSAIRGEGIDKVIRYTAGVLDSLVVGR